MKMALAILCSFVLAGTSFLPAQTPSACVKQVRACCQHDGEMPCCKAKSSPDPQSKPAMPPPTGSQNQLSLLPSSLLVWTLPANPSEMISFHSTQSPVTADAPLYSRDCARLI